MKKVSLIIIILTVIVVAIVLVFVIGPYSFVKNTAWIGNIKIGNISLRPVSGVQYYYCGGPGDGKVVLPCSDAGCMDTSACNYDPKARVNDKCTYATNAQIASPGVPGAAAIARKAVIYRVIESDGSTVRASGMFNTPNSNARVGSSACNQNVPGRSTTFKSWLDTL